MGLTIHYGLSYREPGRRTTAEDCLAALERLRQAALDLPFEFVGPVTHLIGKDADFRFVSRESPNHWALCQAQTYVELPDKSSISVSPKELVFFSAWPGKECEEANFGLARYPTSIVYNGQRYRVPGNGWRWHSFCKTQYASNVSIQHFLRCHSTVCALLLKARELGFKVTVYDEGRFWGKWDYDALAHEVAEWNDMLASFVRALNNALGQDGCIGAPIQDNLAYVTAHDRPETRAVAESIGEVLKVLRQRGN